MTKTNLFRDYHDLGALDPFFDVFGCECGELVRFVEIASTTSRDHIEAHDKDCVEALPCCQYLGMGTALQDILLPTS